VLTCQTPPPGSAGNVSDLFYKPDGTAIQVRNSDVAYCVPVVQCLPAVYASCSLAQCRLPGGVGGGFVFSVSARGITGIASGFTFSFDNPVVTSISPVRDFCCCVLRCFSLAQQN
jgi:hypothetical protein